MSAQSATPSSALAEQVDSMVVAEPAVVLAEGPTQKLADRGPSNAAWQALFESSPRSSRQYRASSASSSVDSSEDDCKSEQSDDIAPEIGFDPFAAAIRRARAHSASLPAGSTDNGLDAAQSSPATSDETLQESGNMAEAERWSEIEGFWSKVVEDTMFRQKHGPIDLSAKGITDILPTVADLSRYVALPPPRFEREPFRLLEEELQSKAGGLVRHQSHLAPFSSHQHNDASTLGARALSRSESAFQPGTRAQSFARTDSALSVLSSRSGGSNASNGTSRRYHDPRDKQATLNIFLAQNALTKLPSALFQLSNLRVLSLRLNQLERLPPAIGELQNLTELNVANNQLRYLPAEILRLRLDVFTYFPNPFIKPARDARLTVRPILSIKAQHGRHAHVRSLNKLEETPVKMSDAALVASGAQPPPVVRFGGVRPMTMDRTRSEAQVEGFLARGLDRIGLMDTSDSVQEGDESVDADLSADTDSTAEAEVPSNGEDERSRILAAAFEDSGSDDEGPSVPAADAEWPSKVEGRTRVLGQSEVANLPTLKELCVRRLLGAYDAAAGEAQGLVSPFLSPMVSASRHRVGGRRRTGSRRSASKPATPLWGRANSSRTLSSRSISFGSSIGSESGHSAKRVPTLLEAYENGTLQSVVGELGHDLVSMLEAARRSATKDWGTKARMNRAAFKGKNTTPSSTRSQSAVFPAQVGAVGKSGDSAPAAPSPRAAAAAAAEPEIEAEQDAFGGVEAVGSLDRGDDACDNPWFSRCPNPRHLSEQKSDPNGIRSSRPTFALERSRGYGSSSSSVSSLGTALGLGGTDGRQLHPLRQQQDSDAETRSVDSSTSRHSRVSRASSTDTLAGTGPSDSDPSNASRSTPAHGHPALPAWTRGPSFSRSDSAASSPFAAGSSRLRAGPSFGRQSGALFVRGFSTSSALSASGLARCASRIEAETAEAAPRDWPLEESEQLSAPVFCRAGEERVEWISHIAGRKVASNKVPNVDVALDVSGPQVAEAQDEASTWQEKDLIPILWRGCSKGCLDFLV